MNQFDEQYKVRELAELVKRIGNKKGLNIDIKSIENPREEKDEHYYKADHEKLKSLGFKATRGIDDQISIMLEDLVEHKDRILVKKGAIVQRVKWKGAAERPSLEKPILVDKHWDQSQKVEVHD